MRIELYKSGLIRKSWKWRLVSSNGRIMASGKGFNSRQNCMDSVMTIIGYFKSSVRTGKPINIIDV